MTTHDSKATESQEQRALFQWATLRSGRYPELALLHHIPNGGSRGKIEAARFKAEGVKAGVPDIFLPVPRGEHHGLYIELKRRHGSRISQAQAWWMEHLLGQGYCVAVCHGWGEAARVIEDYLQ